MMLYLSVFNVSYAQTQDSVYSSSLRIRKIATLQKDTLQIDSLSIDGNSFQIDNVDSSSYLLLPDKGILVWKHNNIPDSISVTYRVLPFNFYTKNTHKKASIVDSNYAFPIYNYSEGDTGYNSFVNFNSLDYNGTYGRSLTLGNSQDVSLNSNFNLQLNGYILDSIRVEAALTDNNIPFQPEGNTQQIQEFDKMYIIFQKNTHKLTVGDFDIERPNSYFVNFNKRVQGIYYQDVFPNNKNIQNKVALSGSIAKGQYARNIIQGIEGNQGPYKLTGNNGEQFFIVLAGSEKVYIDGILLERGENRDYIINYNTGEVTFMPRKLITKDSRIQIEFEYQDRNYLNSLLYFTDELQLGKKWNVKLNIYSNQDAKNQSYLQNFTPNQKILLKNIGDNLQDAYATNVVEDTFSANKVLYKIIDTTINGVIYDSIFVYSVNPDSAKYNVGFSYVGTGKGSYTISNLNSNGRSYIWVPPINGVLQGDYAPISVLITPKKLQLFTIGASYNIDSLKQISFELSSSNYDPNLFSSINNHPHWGFAGRVKYDGQRFINNKQKQNNLKWQNTLSYEYVQKNYKAIAPYRNVEFNRDWNVTSTDSLKSQDEQIINYSTGLAKTNLGKINYDLSIYKRGAYYSANKHLINVAYNRKSINAGVIFNIMSSHSDSLKTQFLRPSAFIEKSFRNKLNITLGSRYEIQHNTFNLNNSDTLLSNSFAYSILTFYAKPVEDKKVNINLSYAIRNDRTPIGSSFYRLDRSDDINAILDFKQWKNHQINFTGTYRKLTIYDSTHTNETSGNSILGRITYSGNILKGFLQPTLLYEAGSGQEQKQQFTYVQVPTGQGVYYWVDYNNDGAQQSNEFEVALYPDQKQYIRVITPTNEYVRTDNVNFNFTLQISPESLWQTHKNDKNRIQKFLSKFSNQLSIQVNNKTMADKSFKGFNPFASQFADTQIIANSSSISNNLYFNRANSVWGVDYIYFHNTGKMLLTYGVESRSQTKHLLKGRYAFAHSFTSMLELKKTNNLYNSGVEGDGRTYNVTSYSAQPSLSWILKSKLRVTGSYQYGIRNNELQYGGETVTIQSGNIDLKLSFPTYGSISTKCTYSNISYNGLPNTSLSFVMLDALQKGNNWLWNLSWERSIGKGLELSIDYEGRAPGGQKVIHSGTMSIRAIL